MSFEIRPFVLDDAELRDVNALLNEVFPKAGFTQALLRWQYCENPDGKAVGFNAYTPDGRMAAHYATMPISAKLFGKEERGLLSLNTATSPAQSGNGLFTRLARATYDQAEASGFSFVIGVSNAASTHGFVSKLGFQFVGPLRAMVGIGKPAVKTSLELDFERLWNSTNLKWRLAHPHTEYGSVVCGNQSCITASTGYPLITAVLGDIERSSLHLENEKKNLGFQLHIGIHPSKDWKRSFYVDIPQRLRPSPLNFIFLDLTGQKRHLSQDRVLFRAMDFDVY